MEDKAGEKTKERRSIVGEARAYELRDQYVETLKANCVVKAEWEDSDGWLDGFTAIFLVIEDENRNLVILKVNDSGAFTPTLGGGWARYRLTC